MVTWLIYKFKMTHLLYYLIYSTDIFVHKKSWLNDKALHSYFSAVPFSAYLISVDGLTFRPHLSRIGSVTLVLLCLSQFKEKVTRMGLFQTWDRHVKLPHCSSNEVRVSLRLFSRWALQKKRRRYRHGTAFKFLSAISLCNLTYLNVYSLALITLTSVFTEWNNEECFSLVSLSVASPAQSLTACRLKIRAADSIIKPFPSFTALTSF